MFVVLTCSCNEGTKTPDKRPQQLQAVKPVLKDAIIGDWKLGDMYAGIDTTVIKAKYNLPPIELESDLSFYKNGRFIKKDRYYTDHNRQEKVAGYTSDYKAKGDTLFIYEPAIKRWYPMHVEMHSQNLIEISNCRGQTLTDTHYKFNRITK